MRYDTYLDDRDPSLTATDSSSIEELKEVVYDMNDTVDAPETTAFLDEIVKLLPRFSHLPTAVRFSISLRDALDSLELSEYDANAFLKSVTG